MHRQRARLAYVGVPPALLPSLHEAFGVVWGDDQVSMEPTERDVEPPSVAVIAAPSPEGAWSTVKAFDRNHPFVPVIAVVDGARTLRRLRTFPSRVDWVADPDELKVSSHLRLVIRLARERAARRRLEHRLDGLQLEDMQWIVSEVSHEISNPLQALLSSLEWLQEQVVQAAQGRAPLDFDAVLEGLRDSQSGALLVSNIAGDLTRSSRMLNIGRVELSDVLETVRRLTRKTLEAQGVTIRFQRGHGPPVQACETRLCQVFLNLIRNASQALEGTDDPRIELVVHPPARGRVRVTVRDNGPGIPDSVASRLFTPWVSTKETGTGLGLAVSRRYLTEMGGSIELASTGPRGTEFVVDLEAMAKQAPRPTLVPDPGPLRARVLVVDDDELVRRSVTRALRGKHDIVDVPSVEEALDVARRESFDLALVDLNLPGRSGIELFELLRDAAPGPPRFLFLSGEFGNDDIAYLEEHDLDWVRKPLGARRLNELVYEMLQQDRGPVRA